MPRTARISLQTHRQSRGHAPSCRCTQCDIRPTYPCVECGDAPVSTRDDTCAGCVDALGLCSECLKRPREHLGDLCAECAINDHGDDEYRAARGA